MKEWNYMAVVIKTFITPGGNYLYDRETNSLLSISKAEYAACQRIESGTATDADWKLLQRYRDQGYLQESKLKEVIHSSTQFLPFHMESHVEQLTMQVSQFCNLNCKYCAYSGNYSNH